MTDVRYSMRDQVDLIRRVDSFDVVATAHARGVVNVARFVADYHDLMVASDRYRAYYESRRHDYDDDPPPRDVDAGDLSHRSARGANAIARNRDPGRMPDASQMATLAQCRGVANTIGTYSESIREELKSAVLTRLRQLNSPQTAEIYAKRWGFADLGQPSDQNAEQTAARAAGQRAQQQLFAPSMADARRGADTPRALHARTRVPRR